MTNKTIMAKTKIILISILNNLACTPKFGHIIPHKVVMG